MKNDYTNNLKSLRKSKGLSQKQMGERLGIAHSNYNTIEKGLADITVSRLYKIAEILEVSIFQILVDNDSDKALKTAKEDIESNFIYNFSIKELQELRRNIAFEIEQKNKAQMNELYKSINDIFNLKESQIGKPLSQTEGFNIKDYLIKPEDIKNLTFKKRDNE